MTWTDFGSRHFPDDGLINDCRNVGLLTIHPHDALTVPRVVHFDSLHTTVVKCKPCVRSLLQVHFLLLSSGLHAVAACIFLSAVVLILLQPELNQLRRIFQLTPYFAFSVAPVQTLKCCQHFAHQSASPVNFCRYKIILCSYLITHTMYKVLEL